MGTLPDGEPVPPHGALPPGTLETTERQPFGMYVHVPFCLTRCGYCDFNTYTAAELAGGVSRASYADLAIKEIRFARRVLGDSDRPVSTVFFGGGTPTVLPASDLGKILAAVAAEFGLANDVEATTEANPETVDERSLSALRDQGINRVSFGMQSAVPHVLRVLDRVHTPGRGAQCARWARAAGFTRVSLDLIYGTPGETDADWAHTVEAALEAGPDHISAYALIVEDGTRLSARIARGELPPPDDDAMADRYAAADDMFGAKGLTWYEVSNWAAGERAICRHNMLYWTDGDWWGIGPGAHSHVGGVRWWNVKHPSVYAARLAGDASPGHAREVLTPQQRVLERVMLRTRLASGCPVALLSARGRAAAGQAVADGLADPAAFGDGRVVLTRRGRLLADGVIRDLVA
ncbi:MAG: radical SAM family heme chaperone HemW [Micromonosporaceae bacterium]